MIHAGVPAGRDLILGWRVAAALCLWLGVISAIGFLVASAPRGLDGTDEAAWVLCAANPWESPGWGIFFGFALHPIWNLGLNHLAGFRVAGILVLLAAAFVFSGTFWKVLAGFWRHHASHYSWWILPTLLAHVS